MTFTDPVFLWGCAAGPLVFFGGLLALGRSRRLLGRLSRGQARRIRHGLAGTALGLEGAAFLLAACALAGPEGGGGAERAGAPPADVMVALDVSRSMWAADAEPNRLEAAKRQVRALAGRLFGAPRGEAPLAAFPAAAGRRKEASRGPASPSFAGALRIGLVTFAGDARLACPLTRDAALFASFLDGAETALPSRGGTDLAAGLAAALAGFVPDRGVPCAVVLVTDGEERTDPSGRGLEETARKARKKGVLLFALALGTAEGGKIPLPGGGGAVLEDRSGRDVVTRRRTFLLEKAARTCGGECLAAADDSFPGDALYGKLAAGLAERFREKRGRPEGALFQWFLLAAVLLFGGAFLLPRGGILPRSAGAALLLLAAGSGLLGSACGCGDRGLDAAREGNRLFRLGRYGAAAAAYERALAAPRGGEEKEASWSARGKVAVNLALALYEEGRVEEALERLGSLPEEGKGAGEAVAEAARFLRGLCFLDLAEGALEEARPGPARLAGALERARAASGIFAAALSRSFHPAEAERDRDLALALAKRIARAMEGGREGPAAGSGKGPSGEGTKGVRKGAAAGEVSGTGGENAPSGDEARRRGPRAEAGGWAGDPGPLSPEEMERIFARLKQLEEGRLERLARRAARRPAGEVEW